jgi:phage-related protein
MLNFLQGLMNGHTIVVIVAVFVFVSAVLSAVGNFLQAIGKQAPGWLGSIINGIASVVHFLNGSGQKKE